jgi:transposase
VSRRSLETAAGQWGRLTDLTKLTAQMFGQDVDPVQIAGILRVSTKSVYQSRRVWRTGGEEALASKGPAGNACKLDEDQLARL